MSTLCHIKYDKYQDKFIETKNYSICSPSTGNSAIAGSQLSMGNGEFENLVREIDGIKTLYFDAANGFVLKLGGGPSIYNKFSIMMKIKIEQKGFLFTLRNVSDSGNLNRLYLGYDSDVDYKFRNDIFVNEKSYNSDKFVTIENYDEYAWHKWLYCYNDGIVDLYIDDVKITSDDFSNLDISFNSPIGQSIYFSWPGNATQFAKYGSKLYLKELRITDCFYSSQYTNLKTT